MSALEKFGLPPTATPDDVKTAWRRVVSTAHPDHGGTEEAFTTARALYKEALAEATALVEASCPTCHGNGMVPMTVGWSTIPVLCPECYCVFDY